MCYMEKNEDYSSYSIEEKNHENTEKTETKISVDARTEASTEHPERNEDAMFTLPEKGAAGVFDGVGGSERGELASAAARDYVQAKISEMADDLNREETEKYLADVIRGADQAVRVKAAEVSAAEGREITTGTTASIVKEVVDDAGKWAVIANAGDSRVYKIKADSSIEQLTVDDGILRIALGVERETEPKKKQEKLNQVRELQKTFNRAKTVEEIKEVGLYQFWKKRNVIFNSLGGPQESEEDMVKPRIISVPLAEGERIMIASDGLDSVGDDDIESMLKKGYGANEILTMVRTKAIDEEKNWRAKPDDTSIIIME